MNRTARQVLVALSVAAMAAACGPRGTDEVESAGATSAAQTGQVGVASATGTPTGSETPAAQGAATPDGALSSEPVKVRKKVKLHEPGILVKAEKIREGALRRIANRDDVGHVAPAAMVRRPMIVLNPLPTHDDDEGGGEGKKRKKARQTPAGTEAADRGQAEPNRRRVKILSVDPATFRPVTPDVTAREPGVWERLYDGDIVVRHDVAHELGIELGGDVVLRGPDGRFTVRVGAFASNGAPPLADVLVPPAVGRQLGADRINRAVVSVSGDDRAGTAARIESRFASLTADVIEEPVQQQAQQVSTGAGASPGTQTSSTSFDFEPFNYTSLGDGMIRIDPDWVARWITTVELPRVGTVQVHRVMAPQLLAAMNEVEQAGLGDHWIPSQFGGGWVPRHIDWSPTRPLSMHAWGLAVDFNTQDNWLGQRPQMDLRIVRIFEKWGFEWGGWWSRPDGMHFELDRVINIES
jgi:hypothetical protein